MKQGDVTDSRNGKPIEGARGYLNGKLFAISDKNGNWCGVMQEGMKWSLKYHLLRFVIGKDEVVANLKPIHQDCLRWDGRTHFIINTALYGGIGKKDAKGESFNEARLER